MCLALNPRSAVALARDPLWGSVDGWLRGSLIPSEEPPLSCTKLHLEMHAFDRFPLSPPMCTSRKTRGNQGSATAFYTVLSQSKAGYLVGTGTLLFCLGGNFAMFPALCSKVTQTDSDDDNSPISQSCTRTIQLAHPSRSVGSSHRFVGIFIFFNPCACRTFYT